MKILLVDDHAMVRAGFRLILEEEIVGAEVSEAATASEALEAARHTTFNVVVLDISLPGRSGLEVLKELREMSRSVPILMMTMYPEDEYALRSFRAGAAGYLTKHSAPDELVQAILKVVSGGKYVSAHMAEKLATSISDLDRASQPHHSLSDRELQVLRMLGDGKTVKDIARELDISEKTISTYRTRILEKLDLRSTAQLIRYAIRAGLVE